MDLAFLIVAVMVLLFIGCFVVGFTVGVPGATKEPRPPKVAPPPRAVPAVPSRGQTPARDPDDSPGMRIRVMLAVLAAARDVLAVGAVVIWEPVSAAYAA